MEHHKSFLQSTVQVRSRYKWGRGINTLKRVSYNSLVYKYIYIALIECIIVREYGNLKMNGICSCHGGVNLYMRSFEMESVRLVPSCD
jgi:hypothetical protein